MVSTQHVAEQLWLWLCCADILITVLSQEPPLLRNYVLSRVNVNKDKDQCLLGCLMSSVVSRQVGAGLGHQLAQIIRIVLDPSSMRDAKEPFLDYVYKNHMHKVVNALKAEPKSAMQAEYHACELLTFCAHHHKARCRTFIIANDVMGTLRVLLLVPDRPEFVCAAIRFLRACIGLKDPAYIKHIVDKQLLDPVMELFVANGARYNLLNSTIIELVNFIRVTNLKMLVHELVMRHASKFEHVRYVHTFQELKIRWEQNQELVEEDGVAADEVMERPEADESAMYDYFNRDSDDESSTSETDPALGSKSDSDDEMAFLRNVSALQQKRRLAADEDELDFMHLAQQKAAKKKSKIPPAKTITVSIRNAIVGEANDAGSTDDRTKRRKV